MTEERIKELELKFVNELTRNSEGINMKPFGARYVFQWIVDNVIKAKEEGAKFYCWTDDAKCERCQVQCDECKIIKPTN